MGLLAYRSVTHRREQQGALFTAMLALGSIRSQASGKDTPRPRLAMLLAFVREGDTVVVHSMDRLARDLDDCAAWCSR
jgi:hypothetical protein